MKFDEIVNQRLLIGSSIENKPGYRYKDFISKGSTGYVFLIENDELSHKLACKFIPESKFKNFYGSEWKNEIIKLNKLKLKSVVVYHSWEMFKPTTIECDEKVIALFYEYIEGITLSEYIKENKDSGISLNFIKNLMSTLLQLLYAMKHVGIEHGDLNPNNIIVEAPNPQIIDQNEYNFRIIDFSSFLKTNLTDFQGVSIILERVLRTINENTLNQGFERFQFDFFRKDLLKALTEEDPIRSDPINRILELYHRIEKMEEEFDKKDSPIVDVKLNTPFDYQSCEQLEDFHDLFDKLYSDKVPHLKRILEKGNTIITGPRGCGKSTIFKKHSLNHQLKVNDINAIMNQDFIGIYYRCDDLYFSLPRYRLPNNLDEKIEEVNCVAIYFECCLIIEFLRNLNALKQKDLISEKEEVRVCEEIWKIFENFYEKPKIPDINSFTELLFHFNKYKQTLLELYYNSKKGSPVFPRLPDLRFLANFCSIFYKKLPKIFKSPIFFFIDDYSTPRVSEDLQKNLNRVLLSRDFKIFFKISTNSPVSMIYNDIDGNPFVESREYTIINFGELFILKLDNKAKLDFIEDLFNRRFSLMENYPIKSLEQLVGSNNISNEKMAEEIAEKRKYFRGYWGKQILSSLCCGDIHLIIRLVGDMVDEIDFENTNFSNSPIISKQKQNDIITRESSQFLARIEDFTKYGPLLKQIVTSFGNISGEWLRQYAYDNHGKLHRFQAIRIECIENFQLTEKSSEILDELLTYSIFIRIYRGRSLQKDQVPRFYLRNIFIPFFKLTFSTIDGFKVNNKEFERFLLKPKKFENEFRDKLAKKLLLTNHKSKPLSDFIENDDNDF